MSSRTVHRVWAAALLAAWPSAALAFPQSVAQVPNGTLYSCNLCHPAGDTTQLTPFGGQARLTMDAGNNVVWSGLYAQDADGDCYSNGLELGDPAGTWTSGTADPQAPTADPGLASAHPAGVAPDLCPGPDPGEEQQEAGDDAANLGLNDLPADTVGPVACNTGPGAGAVLLALAAAARGIEPRRRRRSRAEGGSASSVPHSDASNGR